MGRPGMSHAQSAQRRRQVVAALRRGDSARDTAGTFGLTVPYVERIGRRAGIRKRSWTRRASPAERCPYTIEMDAVT